MSEYDNESVFQRYLLEDEVIDWRGTPIQGICFRWVDLFLIPFASFWAGFAFIWNAIVWLEGAPVLFKLFGLPFLVVGFHILIGRFLLDMVARARTDYAITNNRILIVDGLFKENLTSLVPSRLDDVQLKQGLGKRGTIKFGRASFWESWNIWRTGLSRQPEFYRIKDARDVFQRIERLRQRKG